MMSDYGVRLRCKCMYVCLYCSSSEACLGYWEIWTLCRIRRVLVASSKTGRRGDNAEVGW
jgi:hypothetical protein